MFRTDSCQDPPMSTGPYCHLSDKGLPLPSPALAQIYFQTTDATARKIDREENPDGRSTRLLWSRTEGMPHTDSRSHICGLVKRSSQLDEPLHLPDSFWAVLAGLIGPLLRICIMTRALYNLVIHRRRPKTVSPCFWMVHRCSI